MISDPACDHTPQARGISPETLLAYFFDAITMMDEKNHVMDLYEAVHQIGLSKEGVSCQRALHTVQAGLAAVKQREEVREFEETFKREAQIDVRGVVAQLIAIVLSVDSDARGFVQFIEDNKGAGVAPVYGAIWLQLQRQYPSLRQPNHIKDTLIQCCYEWIVITKAS